MTTELREPGRVAVWVWRLILWSPVWVILLGPAAIWLFSVKEFKAPPAKVVEIPSGYEVIGTETDGGSGGTVVRFVIIAPPSGVSAWEAVKALEAAMEEAGWVSAERPPGEGVPVGTLGLMVRDDERAGFETPGSLQFHRIDPADHEDPVIVVELQYEDWGVGRRQFGASLPGEAIAVTAAGIVVFTAIAAVRFRRAEP